MKRSASLTIILVTLILCCSYVHIFYSHRFTKFHVIDLIVIASSIYFLTRMWIPGNQYLTALVFVLLAGCSLYGLSILQNTYADEQLKLYGKKTNAIVKSVKYTNGPKTFPQIITSFTYTSGGKVYNHYVVDDIEVERRFFEGDTLPIIYSSIDPDLFKEVSE
jgi:hypothetical protein